MPAAGSVLRHAPGAALVLLAAAAATSAGAEPAGEGGAATAPRLLFVGDVLLSRQVAAEIAASGTSPFADVAPLLGSAALLVGNLEGALGTEEGGDCGALRDDAPCFAIPPALLHLLPAAGFDALSLENNHAADLGAGGRARTEAALSVAGVRPLTFEGSPSFVEVERRIVALVATSTVPSRQAPARTIPDGELARKMRLARALADVVVVVVHWGAELVDWPREEERRAASWLAEQGADLVVGSHPHVVQPAACVGGAAVFYSLGNHVFDQRYPETKEGLIADCTMEPDGLSCTGLRTRTRRGSSRPSPGEPDAETACALESCARPRRPPLAVSGVAIVPRHEGSGLALEGRASGRRLFLTPALDLLAVQPIRVGGEEALLTIERHASPIDGERAPRPYVYRVTPHGLFALWRGSALAWPLLDATWLPDGGGCLCALHRADSFLAPDPAAPPGRTAVYRWNGFGFSGSDEQELGDACRAFFVDALPGAAPEGSAGLTGPP